MRPSTDSRERRAAPRSSRAQHELDFLDYVLTFGQFGASAGQTLIVALLPVLIRPYAASSFWIGFSVGGEGVFALLLPFLVGLATDRLPQRLARRVGRHSFFLWIATPVMCASLVLLPWLHGYWLMTAVAFCFFAAQHTYDTPLMALLVDAEPDHKRARVQGVRSIYHSLGLAYGLVAAGLLFSVWQPLPFIIAAGLVVISTVATSWAEKRIAPAHHHNAEGGSLRERLKSLWSDLLGCRPAAWLLAANALWNGAVDGIRPYFFVFAIVVLHITVARTSLGLIGLVVAIASGSALFGKFGDRYDRSKLLEIGLVVALAAMIGGFFVRVQWAGLVVLCFAGLGAAAMTTLPYPLFARLMGQRNTGQYSGLFVISISVGRLLAPMWVGAAIDLGAKAMPQYKGYPFMWPAAAVLGSLGWYALHRTQKASARHSCS